MRFTKTIAIFFMSAIASALIDKAAAQATNQKVPVVSLISELKPFTNIADLPAYREETSMLQVSSYDRTGMNNDGFSGTYSFIRRNADSSLVLFDEQGPGVINRIWTPTPTEDNLDFYIDDTTKPAFTIKYIDLFSGKVFPFVAPLCNNQLGGYYSYLPIPYQKHCMIVQRGKQNLFYQVGFRTRPKGSLVKNFNPNLNAEEKFALQNIQTLWNKKPGANNFITPNQSVSKVVRSTFLLKKGETKTLLQLTTGGRITAIELEPAAAFEGFAKDIDIRITWDNEKTPAVYCPVADFFGFAYGKPSMQSLLIGTSGKTNYSYFPMPFDKGAKIELLYRGTASAIADPVNITARIFHSPQPRRADKEGKFYTYWNHQSFVPLNQPHLFLNATGKGHYVGTVLLARGLTPGMTGFFEGDDSTVVDGKLTMHGTGSEDYFNGGWYAMMDRWDDAYSLPLSGSLDYTLPLSRTGGYRLFLTDKIPFSKSIHHSIEHGPEFNQAPATYTSVAYYYGTTAPANITSPRTVDTRITMPDTMNIYPQLLTYNTTGDITAQRRWKYETGGEAVVFTVTGEAGVRVHLDEVPDGDYKVFIDYAQTPEGALWSAWHRQTPLTDWKSSNAADTTRIEREYVGNLTITPLSNTITLRFKTDENRNQFFLNRVILVKQGGN
jgi:hypothetical protein